MTEQITTFLQAVEDADFDIINAREMFDALIQKYQTLHVCLEKLRYFENMVTETLELTFNTAIMELWNRSFQ